MSGCRDGQRRGVKEEALAPLRRAAWTCRYSYSAVIGFVTVARLRQIPAASSRSMTPAVASTRLCAWVKAFAAAISASATPAGSAWVRLTNLADR